MKSKIYVGPPASGKSTLAEKIVKESAGTAVVIESFVLRTFNFSRCTKETKTIVLDEIDPCFNYAVIAQAMSCGNEYKATINVDKQGERPFCIDVDIVVFSQRPPIQMGEAWFDYRFEVIDITTMQNLN